MAGAATLLALAGLCLGAIAGWMLAQRAKALNLASLRRKLEQAQSEARTDPLTGLWNRKAFDERLTMLAAITRRYGGSLALVLFDVDNFKQINDRFGHAAGDAALVHFARVLRQASRESDVVARLGGDEFAALLPQTDSAGATALAERFRKSLQSRVAVAGDHTAQSAAASAGGVSAEGISLRFSAGVAEFDRGQPADFVERADRALYRAKQAGGNALQCDETAPLAAES